MHCNGSPKQRTALLLAMLLLTSCGSTSQETTDANTNTNTDTPVQTVETEKQPDLAKDLGVSTEELYTAVREGTWTQDMLMEYVALAKADLNGDGEYTRADQWGLMCFDENIFGISLITAGGTKAVDKDENDQLTLLWQDESYVDAMEKAYEIFHNNAVWTDKNQNNRHTAVEFANGDVLFLHGFFLAVDHPSERC